MLSKIFPISKKQVENIETKLELILQKNTFLETKIERLERIEFELRENKKLLLSKLEELKKELYIINKNNISENNIKIEKINHEIFEIVNILNKTLFLEIVEKHKGSLDKLLK